jgi:hypothetical protein
MSLGIALVVIVVLYFLIKSKGFRKAGLVVLGVAVLGVLLAYFYAKHEEIESARKLSSARTLIIKDQIEIIDPRVSFSSYDGRPERITGRLRNNSNYPIRSVELHLQFQDCAANGACETVGDCDKDVLVSVPPGQSRDFDSSVYGNRISVKGTRRWNYSIKSITASVP